ncbi:hypothetical protein [Mycobacterium deserti]|uniref:Uncharacterized protein n=1 Tax=Mycobacterium deserti TaxID=2978347 RepID=A0ABT2MCH0_9MYCO|nr:hypothetical protein [Mycobacterium deserti]MCT7659959.1 hypothetical protein [Mycobacterium deserti]
MKLVADAGLWSTGATVEPAPLVAVLEVSGAVLAWTVDEPDRAAGITFTDPTRADWLWRVFGEAGHTAVAAAVDGRSPDPAQTVDLTGVSVSSDALRPLRRLALGHWLRRWWPASERDGIAALDTALLDAEIAVLTAAAQDFFTDDTFDSEVTSLLAPHAAALAAHARDGDPRVADLVERCGDLADDVGIAMDADAVSATRRDDYALAAGPRAGGAGSGAIASGVDSVNWAGVPPGIFDAAEQTVEWRIEARSSVESVVRVALSGLGSPNGIAVNLSSGTVTGTGVLDADGRATFPIVDAQHRPLTETAAWGHDWQDTTVVVGARVDESPQTRERIRTFARARLSAPPGDAFLAEILAAESDY